MFFIVMHIKVQIFNNIKNPLHSNFKYIIKVSIYNNEFSITRL